MAKKKSTPKSAAAKASKPDVKTVLHVGCGRSNSILDHRLFEGAKWKELRLDIAAEVEPDIVGDMRDMHATVADKSVDGVWSSHNIEHVYPHEVAVVLKEFHRVLKPDGFVYLATPDLQTVCAPVAEGRIDETLYTSPAGPITPVDILYGHRRSLENGRIYMAHHCGFTAVSLGKLLHAAGFSNVHMQRTGYHLYGYALKLDEHAPSRQSGIRITGGAPGQPAAASRATTPQRSARGLTDDLDRPPLVWE